jgi:hypothetical protein
MSFFRSNFVSAKRINTITMKNIASIVLFFFFFCGGIHAQKDSLSLLPDQNPNFRKSRAKYTELAATLTQNEGQTVQQTYKAIDDVQAKKERKELRIARRHERRMARIQSPGYWSFNSGWGYYNGFNGYWPGYGFGQNYGYGQFYSPFYHHNPRCNPVNSVLNTALLGLSLWSIFGR